MGQVFQRTYRAKDGTLKTCATFSIRYYRNGRPHQEPTKFTRQRDAENLLKVREGAIAQGIPVTSQVARYRFEDAVKDITAEYAINARKSAAELERRIRLHLTPFFGRRKMADITSADAMTFAKARLDAGASPAEVNRELAILKRMFTLAVNASVLLHRPHIAMLKENNVRAGFFTDEQVAAVLVHLPPPVRPVVMFAYITGWRVQSEILPMQWRQVDSKVGEVRLDPGTTKNRAGRVFPFTDEMRMLFEDLAADRDALAKKQVICPYVFHRNGKRIRSIRGAWDRACEAAGVPGRIVHDLRRSAVRNMERSGISRSVSMQLTGHLTESIFKRYAITSEGDLQEAARRLNRNSFTPTTGRQTAG